MRQFGKDLERSEGRIRKQLEGVGKVVQNLVYKVKIVKPLNIGTKLFYEIMRELNEQVYKLKNEASTEYHLLNKELEDFKSETGNYPTGSELKSIYGYGGSKKQVYQNIICSRLKGREGISAVTERMVIVDAITNYTTRQPGMKRWEQAIPSFKINQELGFTAQNSTLGEDYTMWVSLFTSEYANSHGFKGLSKQKIHIQLSNKGKEKEVLDKILSGEYKRCDSSIQKQGRHWYVLMSYQAPVKEIELSKDKIMGIDLGVVSAATIAITGERKVHEITGGEIRAFRNRIESRRRSIQNQLPVCSENRRGRGRKTLLKPLEVLSKKASNFKETVNHRYSKYIVDLAEKNGVGVIQMENLTGINKRSSFLATWSYYDLQQKITYKANLKGIEVKLVKPQYTSQRCCRCGVIDSKSRKNQATFKCETCEHTSNADWNAARNIGMDGIEGIIVEQLKVQKECGGQKDKKEQVSV